MLTQLKTEFAKDGIDITSFPLSLEMKHSRRGSNDETAKEIVTIQPALPKAFEKRPRQRSAPTSLTPAKAYLKMKVGEDIPVLPEAV